MESGELMVTLFFVIPTIVAGMMFVILSTVLFVRGLNEFFREIGVRPSHVWGTVIVAAFAAFLMWFVLGFPKPSYFPAYGSDPCDIPHQMKD